MSENGRLPDSELAPIRGGRLRRDAAAAWNAMHAAAFKDGIDLWPTGPRSSYRTYAQQVELWNIYKAGGNLAAEPGTSNHGWGLAVDVATHEMRGWIDAHGAAYGWSKKWSDAAGEWWHIKFRTGVWQPPVDTKMREGQVGPMVKLLTHRLAVAGWLPHSGFRFNHHVALAVYAYQKHHKLRATGVVDDPTWAAIKASAGWARKTGRKEIARPL